MDEISRQLEELLQEKQKLYQIRNVVPLSIALVDAEIMRLQSLMHSCTIMSTSSGEPINLFPYLTQAYMDPTTARQSKNASAPNKKRLKLPIPADRFPEYNFVGRLLGPRGATLKTLEKETGCKIMIRGKGSIRKDRENEVRGKPGYEHVFSDPLHVVIEAEMEEAAAIRAMTRAKEEIEALLVPISEERDLLKRQQLRDLAMIKGPRRNIAGSVPTPSGFSRYQELRSKVGANSGGGTLRPSPVELYEDAPFPLEDVNFDEHRDLYSSPRRRGDALSFSFLDMSSALSEASSGPGPVTDLVGQKIPGGGVANKSAGQMARPGSSWDPGSNTMNAAKSIPGPSQSAWSPAQWQNSYSALSDVWHSGNEPGSYQPPGTAPFRSPGNPSRGGYPAAGEARSGDGVTGAAASGLNRAFNSGVSTEQDISAAGNGTSALRDDGNHGNNRQQGSDFEDFSFGLEM
mmetsp:Transcript_8456/g.25409  ORF Transcript_8456/g.25409 Transcript_8456/m.25409 type:complete len:460 (+) Transcript_8456:254-1633(+)